MTFIKFDPIMGVLYGCFTEKHPMEISLSQDTLYGCLLGNTHGDNPLPGYLVGFLYWETPMKISLPHGFTFPGRIPMMSTGTQFPYQKSIYCCAGLLPLHRGQRQPPHPGPFC